MTPPRVDEAFLAAEARLPEGWRIVQMLRVRRPPSWLVKCEGPANLRGFPVRDFYGPTLVAALSRVWV